MSRLPSKVLPTLGRLPRRVSEEIVSTAPAFAFFLIGFLLVLTIIKLILAEYSIGFTAFPEALVGALFAAKAVMVLDQRDYASLRRFPRVYAVICKTGIYVLVVLILAVIEHSFGGYRQTGSIRAGIELFVYRVNRDRLFGLLLCVAVVFVAYFVIREVDRVHGKGSMYALFFRRPAPGGSDSAGRLAERKSALG